MLSQTLTQLIIVFMISLVLLNIPIIGKYVAVVNTLIHEIGHALVSILTGGKVSRIELFANTEGTAWTRNPFWIGKVLTSLAGYPAASAAGLLFMYLLSIGKPETILLVFAVFLVLGFLFWIKHLASWFRNIYGFLWLVSIGGLYGWLVYYQFQNPESVSGLVYMIAIALTGIVFVESIKSSFTILVLSIKRMHDAGDASNLARATRIPAPIWGLFFFAQSLYFGYMGINLFL